MISFLAIAAKNCNGSSPLLPYSGEATVVWPFGLNSRMHAFTNAGFIACYDSRKNVLLNEWFCSRATDIIRARYLFGMIEFHQFHHLQCILSFLL